MATMQNSYPKQSIDMRSAARQDGAATRTPGMASTSAPCRTCYEVPGRAARQIPPRPPGRARRRAGTVLLAILVILLGTGLMLYPKMTDLRYTWAQWRLAVEAKAAQATASAASGGLAADCLAGGGGGVALPDGAVALLEIPSIDLKAYVLSGTSRSVLARGPGHYPGTPLPGETGNSSIAGHRTMHGQPFHDLDLLQPGDEIYTGTSERTTLYRVVRVVVVYPNETEVIAQTGVDRLTLTTCHPKGSAARRLVVVAERTK